MKKVLLASMIAGLSAGMTVPAMAAMAASQETYEQYQATIDAEGNSKVSGNVVFIPGDNDQMTVKLEASNANGMSAGLHEGICRYADDGEEAPDMLVFNENPAFELNALEDGKSTSTIELTVEALMGDPYSVAIYDGSSIVGCGNVQ